MKIEKKYSGILTAIIMATLMATVMSFALTIINLGFGSGLWAAFINTWSKAIIVAIPTGIILLPIVKRIVAIITI